MGNILLVLFLFGLHRADLVYSEFGLHIIPVYSEWFTQDSCLFKIWFTQDFCLLRVVNTRFVY